MISKTSTFSVIQPWGLNRRSWKICIFKWFRLLRDIGPERTQGRRRFQISGLEDCQDDRIAWNKRWVWSSTILSYVSLTVSSEAKRIEGARVPEKAWVTTLACLWAIRRTRAYRRRNVVEVDLATFIDWLRLKLISSYFRVGYVYL